MLIRILRFARTFGWRATAIHALRRISRTVVPPLRQVYRADLTEIFLASVPERPLTHVRAFTSLEEVPALVLEELHNAGTIDDRRPSSQDEVTLSLKRLFSKGAVFWTCFEGPRLAGYLWSIRGSRERPCYHFVPLGSTEAVFLAHEIFPAFRGHGLNSTMTHLVMAELGLSGVRQVYVDIELTNARSLRSFSKTVFTPIGLARMKKFKNRQVVIWVERKQFIPAFISRKD